MTSVEFEAGPGAGDILDVKAFGFGDLDDVLAASKPAAHLRIVK